MYRIIFNDNLIWGFIDLKRTNVRYGLHLTPTRILLKIEVKEHDAHVKKTRPEMLRKITRWKQLQTTK